MPQVQFVGAPGGGLTHDVTLGSITSEILFVNVQYHGTYTCIGSNDGFESNSSAVILVQVLDTIKLSECYYCFIWSCTER